MKVFIGGSRSIKTFEEPVREELYSIYQKGYDILIGDCRGVDTIVQSFYADLHYGNVLVYAGNGKARNNVGNWRINAVPTDEKNKGFYFYRQKDLAMAEDADCGFMIWDEKTRGTLNNMLNLCMREKPLLVYLSNRKKMLKLKTMSDLQLLVGLCDQQVKTMYSALIAETELADAQI